VEIDLIWQRPWTLSSGVYLYCRYMGLVYLLVPVAAFAIEGYDVPKDLDTLILKNPHSIQEIPDVIDTLQNVVSFFSLAVIQGIFLVRVCAVYGNSKRLKWTLIFLLLIEISLAFVGMFSTLGYDAAHFVILVNVPVLVFECLLLALLLRGTVFSRTMPRHVKTQQRWKPLSVVILRDGCVYFVIVIVMNILDAVLQWELYPLQYIQDLSIFLEAVLGPHIVASLAETHGKFDTLYLVPY